jgi:hypothetical protein
MSTATEEKPKEKEKFRYRLNRGMHIDNDPYRRKKNGEPIERTFKPGDIIETDQVLSHLNGGGEMTPKFEKLDDREFPTAREPHPMDRRPEETPKEYAKRLAGIAAEAEKAATEDQSVAASQIDKMNEKDLKQYAADEEIDIKGINGVEALRKAIKAAVVR